MRTHGEELKEGNVLVLWAVALLVIVKEEEVCHANVKHVSVVAVLLHQVQPLLSAVSSSEECLGDLLRPAGPSVALNRQDVQLLSGGTDIERQEHYHNLAQLFHLIRTHIVTYIQMDGWMDGYR